MQSLDEFDDDILIWLNNYWQPIAQIVQRPMDSLASRSDGIYIW